MVTLCFVMAQSNVEASELDKKCTGYYYITVCSYLFFF